MSEHDEDNARPPDAPPPYAPPASDFTPPVSWRPPVPRQRSFVTPPAAPAAVPPPAVAPPPPPVAPKPVAPPPVAPPPPPRPPVADDDTADIPPVPHEPPPPAAYVAPRVSSPAAPGVFADDDLNDTFAIDAAVDGDDAPAPGFTPAASPLPRAPREGKHRRDEVGADADLSRFDAAVSGAPLPPGPPYGPGGPSAAAAEPEMTAPKRRRKAPWWELPALVALAILIAVLVKSFVVQPFYIPSESMEKTLHGCPTCSGDRILVNKPIYDLRDPHGGDIVVFHAPPGWDDEPASKPPSNPVLRAVRGFGQLVGFVPPDGLVLVKRVIATGGETVKGDSSGHVLISKHGDAGPWTTLNEPYVFENGIDTHAAFGPVTVPKGRLWVMGDHRNDSADSRFHCGVSGSQGTDGPECDATSSTVPVSDVIGKATVIAWPPSRWRTLGTPSTFKHIAESLPMAAGLAFTAPLFFVRRRRRRRDVGA